MAFVPIFGTGFEMGSVPLPASLISTYEISSGGHNGNYCLAASHSTGQGYAKFPGTETDVISVGIWTLMNNSYGQTGYKTQGAINIMMTDGTMVSIIINAGYWCGYVGTTLVAQGTILSEPGMWTNVQIDIKISDAGGYIKTKVNGAKNFEYTGDTKPGTSAVIQYLQLGGKGWIDAKDRWDDLVIGSGGYPGDVRFDGLLVTADSSPRQWQRNGISDQTPPVAPTVAAGAAGSLSGAYQYKVSLVDTIGETWAGAAGATVNPSSQKVELSGIATGLAPDTTARKIYRTEAGGSTFKLLTTISDNTTTTYSDDTLDSALGVLEPDKTLNYQAIDETPPNDADYIYSSVNGNQCMYTLKNWDSTAKIPRFLLGWWRGWKDTADGQAVKLLTKSGASSTASAAQELTTYAQDLYQIYTQAPDASEWSDAAIDALEMGIEAVIPS